MKTKNIHIDKIIENFTVNVNLDPNVDTPDEIRTKVLEVFKSISNDYLCNSTMCATIDPDDDKIPDAQNRRTYIFWWRMLVGVNAALLAWFILRFTVLQ